MPLQNRVDPFGELFATPRARHCSWAIAAGASTMTTASSAKRRWASTAVDLLRARLQEPPSRCLGRRLHRAVLPRRGDGARRRSPALLRMPAQGRRALRRRCSRAGGERARAAAMDEVLHAERLDGKAKRLHRRKIDDLPDGAMIALGGDAFAMRGEAPAALDAVGLWPRAAAPARNAGRRAHAALDPGRAGRRLPAALAPKFRITRSRRFDRRPGRRGRHAAGPGEEHDARHDQQHRDHQGDAGRPAAQRPGEAADRGAEAAADVEARHIEADRRGAAGLGA